MNLAKASIQANAVLIALYPFCEGLKIAGSIRREKLEVHDIDIVAMPKDFVTIGPLGVPVSFAKEIVWSQLFPKALKQLGLKVEASGQELLRCSYYDGFQVDIYRARPETWGVILLMRTGSRAHNVKLCAIAKSKGLMLSASRGILAYWIDGKCIPQGNVIASRSEEEIFAALGLGFVEPQNREVPY